MLIKQIKEIEIRNKIPIEIEKTADQIKRIQENWKEYIKENINIINSQAYIDFLFILLFFLFIIFKF